MAKEKSKNIKSILYGAHPIIEMLKAKRRKLYTLYTRKPLSKSWDRLKPYLPKTMPNIQYVEKNALDGIAETTDHMGIVALVSPYQFISKMFDPKKKPFILLLDGVQDVGNLGAILRSAYCAGVDGIILCKSNSAPMTPAVFKASAGYAEHLDIYVAASAKSAVQEIIEAGYNLYMAVIDGKDATKIDFQRPTCLVIGNKLLVLIKISVKRANLLPFHNAHQIFHTTLQLPPVY
ncbi:RNA methyltransferase [bacterium]|nr:MAG: RNA methyltransferase [bacterium]